MSKSPYDNMPQKQGGDPWGLGSTPYSCIVQALENLLCRVLGCLGCMVTVKGFEIGWVVRGMKRLWYVGF